MRAKLSPMMMPSQQDRGIFMDAPKVSTTAELVAAAKDTAEWRKLVEETGGGNPHAK